MGQVDAHKGTISNIFFISRFFHHKILSPQRIFFRYSVVLDMLTKYLFISKTLFFVKQLHSLFDIIGNTVLTVYTYCSFHYLNYLRFYISRHINETYFSRAIIQPNKYIIVITLRFTSITIINEIAILSG